MFENLSAKEVQGFFKGGYDSLPLDKWLEEKEHRMLSVYDRCATWTNQYPFGFHVFKTKYAASMLKNEYQRMASVIKKVEYRKAHTLGRDWNNCKVIVAKEIKIL